MTFENVTSGNIPLNSGIILKNFQHVTVFTTGIAGT